MLQNSWMHIFACDCCKWPKECFFFMERAIRTGWCLSPCSLLDAWRTVGSSASLTRVQARLIERDERRRPVISDLCTVQVISSQGPHWRALFLCHKVTSFWWLYGWTDWPKFSGLEFTDRDFPPLLTWNYVVEAARLTSLQQCLLTRSIVCRPQDSFM